MRILLGGKECADYGRLATEGFHIICTFFVYNTAG